MIRPMRMATMVVALAVLAAGCSGKKAVTTPSSSGSAAVKKGGILRIGTTSAIDSLNPYNYIETQATNAMIMIYPQLVQYAHGPDGFTIVGDFADSWSTSTDGKDLTFKLKPNAKWSDGQALTADDAAWTINTTVKYQNRATAEMASALTHVKSADATDASTLEIGRAHV